MTKEEQFVNELIGYIFAYPDDDYMTMECLCRKLVKHGLLDKVDGYYQPKECDRMGFYIEELPTEFNGITMQEADYLADEFLKDTPCNRMWDAMRALRDFYETVTSEAVDMADRKTENSSEKPNNSTTENPLTVDKDINVRSKDEPLTCRNKDHYADCEYKDNCNPVVCFKALDEFREMVTEPQERSE